MDKTGYMIKALAQNRHKLCDGLNANAPKHGIVFVGDSLIENFPINELCKNSNTIFNRGIASSSTYDVLEQIVDTVIPLQPQKIFLLIGTNDFMPQVPQNDDESIAKRILKIADELKDSIKSTQIFVISLLPIHSSDGPQIYKDWQIGKTNQRIESVNAIVQKLCKIKKYIFINVFPLLLDSTGELAINFTLDGTHINIPAYEILLNEINPYL